MLGQYQSLLKDAMKAAEQEAAKKVALDKALAALKTANACVSSGDTEEVRALGVERDDCQVMVLVYSDNILLNAIRQSKAPLIFPLAVDLQPCSVPAHNEVNKNTV